jgi:hypothetical protein
MGPVFLLSLDGGETSKTRVSQGNARAQPPLLELVYEREGLQDSLLAGWRYWALQRRGRGGRCSQDGILRMCQTTPAKPGSAGRAPP